MKATMIGTICNGIFSQGINVFPVLDSPVQVTTKKDLLAIFGDKNECIIDSYEEPGYCISIGQSAVFPEYDVKIDPDVFFGKHAAIIGSTGSGKSCSIATIIQSVIEHSQVQQTRFIILDTNGEYLSAFKKQEGDGTWISAKEKHKCLYIPTDPADEEHLVIPYWFMNSDDFVRLFRASPGVQRPVLLNALLKARTSSNEKLNWLHFRDDLINYSIKILSLCSQTDRKVSKDIWDICQGMKAHFEKEEIKQYMFDLARVSEYCSTEKLFEIFNDVGGIVREKIKDPDGQYESYAVVDLDKEHRIKGILNPFLHKITNLNVELSIPSTVTSDCPSFFSRSDFRYKHIEEVITRDETNSNRVRENCSTMLMRIYRLLEDSRFEFLFGPNSEEWPQVKHSLATFIRDILGIQTDSLSILSNEDDLPKCQLPFYDRQRNGAESSNVVVIDLSLLASEVLENVTALIGRLIHEFLQRLSDPISGVNRGEFPVVLVLEEAQNYIHDNRKNEEESISKEVFERIAREGRKYGLGLVVASQRPSELSKTVLSQCNSFIVHRLQNPEDLRYFREIVPSIYGQLLEQLPALAPQSALILGECIQAPALVEMREADPIPRSKNPKFMKSWASSDAIIPNIEEICAKWEGKGSIKKPEV